MHPISPEINRKVNEGTSHGTTEASLVQYPHILMVQDIPARIVTLLGSQGNLLTIFV